MPGEIWFNHHEGRFMDTFQHCIYCGLMFDLREDNEDLGNMHIDLHDMQFAQYRRVALWR